jgi:hypothetical protein
MVSEAERNCTTGSRQRKFSAALVELKVVAIGAARPGERQTLLAHRPLERRCRLPGKGADDRPVADGGREPRCSKRALRHQTLEVTDEAAVEELTA